MQTAEVTSQLHIHNLTSRHEKKPQFQTGSNTKQGWRANANPVTNNTFDLAVQTLLGAATHITRYFWRETIIIPHLIPTTTIQTRKGMHDHSRLSRRKSSYWEKTEFAVSHRKLRVLTSLRESTLERISNFILETIFYTLEFFLGQLCNKLIPTRATLIKSSDNVTLNFLNQDLKLSQP